MNRALAAWMRVFWLHYWLHSDPLTFRITLAADLEPRGQTSWGREAMTHDAKPHGLILRSFLTSGPRHGYVSLHTLCFVIRYIMISYVKSRYITLHYVTFRHITCYYITIHNNTLHCIIYSYRRVFYVSNVAMSSSNFISLPCPCNASRAVLSTSWKTNGKK